VVFRLFYKNDVVVAREPGEQVLRALVDEIPAQMAKDDDRIHVTSTR
jgi:hypothetical protein